MTEIRLRGVCRMKDLSRDIQYTHDLIEAMKENRWNEQVYVSLSDKAA